MAGKVAKQAAVYEEFEPFCKWQRKEDRDILEIHLQEFKKEQLKVQISNQGMLKISGERPLDATTHTKFYKEVAAPSSIYDAHAIHAKFMNGVLIVTLPKLKTSPPEINPKASSSEPSKTDRTPTTAAGGGGAKERTPDPSSMQRRAEGRKRPTTMGSKVAVSLAVAVLVAYVLYMYKSTFAKIDD